MASHLCKAIRDATESDSYDLKGLSQEQATAFVESTFKEPLKLDCMIKVTLVVGAGKLARQKYDDNLGKWVCSALKEIGYEDDRGATAALDCAGSFKFQHDTGKNEKFVHVFPRVDTSAADAGGETEGEYAEEGAPSGGPISAEWLCVASELPTFKQMVEVKMPAWIEKRRCMAMLKEEMAKLQEAEAKLARLETLDADEQRLFDEVDRDLLEQKVALLVEAMKSMVEAGKLTAAEKELVLEQTAKRAAAVEEELKATGADKPKMLARLEAQKANLAERMTKIKAIEPFRHDLANVREMRKTWVALVPLDKLMEKAGPKGRWSTKLTQAEVARLGDKEDLDARLQALYASARHWFEEQEEFDHRIAEAKKTTPQLQRPKQRQAAAKPPAPAPDGWATVGGTGKRKGGAKKPAAKGGARGGGGGAGAGGGAFGALMD